MFLNVSDSAANSGLSLAIAANNSSNIFPFPTVSSFRKRPSIVLVISYFPSWWVCRPVPYQLGLLTERLKGGKAAFNICRFNRPSLMLDNTCNSGCLIRRKIAFAYCLKDGSNGAGCIFCCREFRHIEIHSAAFTNRSNALKTKPERRDVAIQSQFDSLAAQGFGLPLQQHFHRQRCLVARAFGPTGIARCEFTIRFPTVFSVC